MATNPKQHLRAGLHSVGLDNQRPQGHRTDNSLGALPNASAIHFADGNVSNTLQPSTIVSGSLVTPRNE